jgi:hypothetical protein
MQPRQSELSSVMKSPTCLVCGKGMRFVSAAPATQYTNLKHTLFECGCGRTSDALVADND